MPEANVKGTQIQTSGGQDWSRSRLQVGRCPAIYDREDRVDCQLVMAVIGADNYSLVTALASWLVEASMSDYYRRLGTYRRKSGLPAGQGSHQVLIKL